MKTTILSVVAALGLIATWAQGPGLPVQYGPVVPVQGVLLDGRTDWPAPGLRVSLIHQVLGRSAPSFSDASGHFGWSAIPIGAPGAIA